MEQVVLIIHLVLAVLLIGVVMLQRSEGVAPWELAVVQMV